MDFEILFDDDEKHPAKCKIVTQPASPSEPMPAERTLDEQIRDLPNSDVKPLYTLLHETMTARRFIYVRPEGVNMTFQSLILSMDIDCLWLTIDQLFPETAFQSTAAHFFDISLSHQGKTIHFLTQVLVHKKSPGIDHYILALPIIHGIEQQRNALRLEIDGPLLGCVLINVPQFDAVVAQIKDLSFTGASLKLFGDFCQIIRPGDILSQGRFYLTNELVLYCDMEVRHKEIDEEKNLILGCRFINLSTDKQRQLEHFLMDLKRKYNA